MNFAMWNLLNTNTTCCTIVVRVKDKRRYLFSLLQNCVPERLIFFAKITFLVIPYLKYQLLIYAIARISR